MKDYLQEKAERLVKNEIHACASSLIYGISNDYPAICENFPDMFVGPASIGNWLCPRCFDEREAEPEETQCEKCQCVMAIEDDFEVTDYQEVFEHWIISDYLADKLIARGETVERDFYGLVIWSRTTTGQAIYMDWVIQDIVSAF